MLENINSESFNCLNDIFFRINDIYKNLFNISLSINNILKKMPDYSDFDDIKRQINEKKLSLRTIEKKILSKCKINDELNSKKKELAELLSLKDKFLNNALIKANELDSVIIDGSKLNLTAFVESLYDNKCDIDELELTYKQINSLYPLLNLNNFICIDEYIDIQKQICEIESSIDNYFDSSFLKECYDSLSDEIRQLESEFFNKDIIKRNKIKLYSLFNEFAENLLEVNKLVLYFIAMLRNEGFLLGGFNYD